MRGLDIVVMLNRPVQRDLGSGDFFKIEEKEANSSEDRLFQRIQESRVISNHGFSLTKSHC